MKKIYNVPATTVVALNVRQMLAASPAPTDVKMSTDSDDRVNANEFDTRRQGVGSDLWSDMQ